MKRIKDLLLIVWIVVECLATCVVAVAFGLVALLTIHWMLTSDWFVN